MGDSGICYTWSGNEKRYEPNLFSAQLHIFGFEYCYRYDSPDSYTLVFGEDKVNDSNVNMFSTYLPYGDISINHNIQANGEDHYTYSGTYIMPGHWSPPPGVDGPFDSVLDLKYPYYYYAYSWSGVIYTFYNNIYNYLDMNKGGVSKIKLYGNKRDE